MTKEEAKQILERIMNNNFYGGEIQTACKMGIEALSQPSLPFNLDEAAENSWAVYEYRESPKGLYSTCYIDGFKAGAEWMAGQGVTKEAVIGMATGKIIISVSQQALDELDLCPDDKVVVQIRKK